MKTIKLKKNELQVLNRILNTQWFYDTLDIHQSGDDERDDKENKEFWGMSIEEVAITFHDIKKKL